MTPQRSDTLRRIQFAITSLGIGVSVWLVISRWPDAQLESRPELEPRLLMARETDSAKSSIPAMPFADITRLSGLDFIHHNGATGEMLLPETMGGGGAFFDYDGDGDPDLICINSCDWPWSDRGGDTPSTLKLYKNDGTGHFSDITSGSGLEVSGIYGNGVACGDFDNDGAIDLYVTAVGMNHLYRNRGQGRFEDITTEAGVAGADDAWSTSAGWFDYDLDGDLDLFVCNYLNWSADTDRAMEFTLTGSVRGYGRPTDFSGAHPYLFRNDGNGDFTDVSEAMGICLTDPDSGEPRSKALGLTFAYVDSDGRLDVIVANDTVPNQVFLNRDGVAFEEVGAVCGMAFDNDGGTRGAMGIVAGNFRRSDALGVVIGNFSNEMTALYVNQTPGAEMPLFRDEAVANGVGPVTRIALTFGVLFADVDLNGWADIVASNGHLDENIHLVQRSQKYAQMPQLLWNQGLLRQPEFVPAGEESVGTEFLKPMVGRGATSADIDADGDPDIVLFALGDAPRLLKNEQEQGHHWLKIKLTGDADNRDAIGARVFLLPENGPVMQQTVMPTCSYQSQIDLPLVFGLGAASRVKSLKVIWPGGSEQIVDVPEVDRLLRVTQIPRSE